MLNTENTPNNNLPGLFALQENNFDLRSFLFRYVLRYWYLYLFLPGLAVGGAWLFLRYTAPEYEIKSSLLIKDETEGASGEEALFKDLGLIKGAKNLENEVQILKSESLMRQVVDKLKLNVEYRAIGRLQDNEIYDKSPVKVDSFVIDSFRTTKLIVQQRDNQHFELVGGEPGKLYRYGEWFQTKTGTFLLRRDSLVKPMTENIDIRFLKAEDIALRYANRLSVKPLSTYSSVLGFKLRDPVPSKGIDILNALVEIYNQAAIEDKNKVSQSTIDFIAERLKYLTEELSTVEGDVQTYKQRNEIAAKVESGVEIILEEVNHYDEKIAAFEVQQSVLQSMESFIRSGEGRYQLIPANLDAGDPALSDLIAQYNQLALEREKLLRSAKPDNPALLGVSQQLNTLFANVLETIKKVDSQLRTSLSQLREKRQILLEKVRKTPRIERELQEIMRQQSIKQNLYLFLLQKREETALTLATTVPNSRVVDAGRSGKIPVYPNRQIVYILSLLLSLGLVAFIIWVLEMLDDRVRSEDDITRATQTPVIGGIAQSSSGQNVVVSGGNRTAVAEMFRLLRTNLQFFNTSTGDKKCHTVLLTSSTGGEGKTFVTVNLGVTLALSGKKTILLGLDLRKPKLGNYLKVTNNDKGITNYLIGQQNLEAIILPTGITPNLDYIGCGPVPPNPAELLLLDKLDKLIQILQRDYDYILIDTPPVGMVADAFLLSRFADTSLYLVRHDETRKGMLRLLEELHQQKRLPNLAIVFNGLKAKGSYGYGYGYGYGYKYGYGGYYDEDKTPPSRWKKIATMLFSKEKRQK